MHSFTLALAAFVLLHVGLSATGLRGVVIGRIGEWPYRGLFSLASIALLAWLTLAYGEMRADPFDALNAAIWGPPTWARHVTHLLAALGFMLAVAGLTTRSPTMAGMEGAVAREDAASGILRITRHPFLWGVALWSLGHLIVNGERFALMLFGALGLMALLGTRSIDRKSAARNPDAWTRFAAQTSNIPFAAIAQGRNMLKLGEIWWRLLLGLVVFGLIGYFHGALIGVPAFDGGR